MTPPAQAIVLARAITRRGERIDLLRQEFEEHKAIGHACGVTIAGRNQFDMGRSISVSIKYDFIPLPAAHARLKERMPRTNGAVESSERSSQPTKQLLKRNLMVVVTWASYLSCTRDDDWHSEIRDHRFERPSPPFA
ncbi:MAG TPA: hypothetical protein VNZ53_51475 [Steroidobacteraceae bacterium]|nr:hypothetical protein [Steroidobacteraceae bacterium]